MLVPGTLPALPPAGDFQHHRGEEFCSASAHIAQNVLKQINKNTQWLLPEIDSTRYNVTDFFKLKKKTIY